MSSFTDRMDLGYFPLQDYAAANDGVPVSVRQSLGAGRIVKFTDPTRAGGSASESMIEYGRENGLGTLGDVHPWLFWQTRDRSVRGSGAWSQLFGTMVMGAQGGTAASGPTQQPIRDDSWHNDTRLREKSLSWPIGFPSLCKGSLLLGLAGTEEAEQHDLGFWADPRLIAPNAAGPGSAGTLVIDLQPTATLCMGGSDTPGEGGRHARLQSLVRVIAVPRGSSLAGLGGSGNVLALNHSVSSTDGLPGYGAVFARLVGASGGGATRPPTITPRPPAGVAHLMGNGDPDVGYGAGSGRAIAGEPNIGTGSFGSNLGLDQGGSEEKTPKSFGEFHPRRIGSHGVALMAAVEAYGPIHGGADGDKHQHGYDGDGHPVNAAHISTGAYFFQNADKDGPIEFAGDYPNPPGWPLTARTHLSWDGAAQHPFRGGARAGLWRLWTEVPYYAPSEPPTEPPTRPPSTPQPPTPPPTPPTAPPPTITPRPQRGPTTPSFPPPGPVRPPSGPRGPRGPIRPPSGPIRPPTGGERPGGIPPSPPQGPVRPPGGGKPPEPPKPPRGPVRPGGGKSMPGQPGTAPPEEPQPPTCGPSQPGPPNGGICSEPAKGTTAEPNNPAPTSTSGSFSSATVMPSYQATLGGGEILPQSAGNYVGGPGGMGTQVVDPRIPLGRLSGLDPWTREREQVPGLVERVGDIDTEAAGVYSIFHPLQESYGAVAFRPQLTIAGAPNFEHNPQVPATVIAIEDRVRPQVLVARAWGAQSTAGDWKYTELPAVSRARGGTAAGGVLFSPPRFELEDYLAVNSGANVDDITSSRATRSYICAAPGVSFALGKPTSAGALAANSVEIRQETGVATRPMAVLHNAVEVLRGYSSGSEVFVELGGTTALRVPVGTTAQRPATPTAGHLRFNSTTPAFEGYDGSTWVAFGSGGGGGAPVGATYVCISADATLTNERTLAGEPTVVSITDSGAGAAVTVGLSANGVTFAKIVQSAGAGCSVVGRSANSAGNFAEIAAGSDNLPLRRVSNVLGFGTLTATTALTMSTGKVLARTSGGTGAVQEFNAHADGLALLDFTGDFPPDTGTILYYDGGWQALPPGSEGQALVMHGGIPTWD